MASLSLDFEKFLRDALDDAGVDGEVYGGYISGSLGAMEGSPSSDIETMLQETLSVCLVGS